MGKLHELLAVEADLQRTAGHVLEEAKVTFGKKRERFWGQTRTVTFFDEARRGENLEETKAMESTVDDKLAYLARMVGRYYDATLQKDSTNQKAKADLVVDGMILGVGLPAPWLLGMEHKLATLRQVLVEMPTLAPGVTWTLDPDLGEGVYRAKGASQFKTEKTSKPVVLYEATKEHPAQVKESFHDVPVARLDTTQVSGMLTVARKSEILDRLDTLIRAVKKARQRANSVNTEKKAVADVLFDYIIDGEFPSV